MLPNVAATDVREREQQLLAYVETSAGDADRCARLTELLREDHPLYDQCGRTTVVRMRGWILLALAHGRLSEQALLFVLEELDTGIDAYLVAAAARALRAWPDPAPAFAPFVIRAIANIRYQDELVSFDTYGGYGRSSERTSALRELLAALAWLGPHAREVLPEVEALRQPPGALPKKLWVHVDEALAAIRGGSPEETDDTAACCALPAGLDSLRWWAPAARGSGKAIESARFEDQDGAAITFGELFRGRPSIVAFFYTRCDNPLKCSLTITKLGRVQKLLEARGLAARIRTAAITYDPAFDRPERLRGYGQNRGLRLDAGHRMLRATDGIDAVRRYFRLGVNFVESLVNRHRVEVYVLDAEGRIAATFARIHWSEEEVVARTVDVMQEAERSAAHGLKQPAAHGHERPAARAALTPAIGTLASLLVAFFPKCPLCWAALLSPAGLIGLHRIPYAPWLQPLLVVLMLINLTSVGLRARATGRLWPACLVGIGSLAIALSRATAAAEAAAVVGVTVTCVGSLASVAAGDLAQKVRTRYRRSPAGCSA